MLLDSGLITYWIAKLALIFRHRIEHRLKKEILDFESLKEHWLRLFLPYLEKKKEAFVFLDKSGEQFILDTPKFFEILHEILPKLKENAHHFDPILRKNLEIFSDSIGLDEEEKIFLTFAMLSETDPNFGDFLGYIGEISFSSVVYCLAKLFGWSLETLHRILVSGCLVSGGLISQDFWIRGKVYLSNVFKVDDSLKEQFFYPSSGQMGILFRLFSTGFFSCASFR